MQSGATFREVQHMRRVWWVMLIILAAAALMWYGFFEQTIGNRPFGTNPGPDWLMWILWLGVGVGLPLLFLYMRLIVEVRTDHIFVQFAPLTTRQIPYTEIVQVEARTYQPIREYGGWGIRGWRRSRRAYSISGNRGVELTLRSGQQVMLGSQQAEALAQAIDEQMSA